MKGKDFSLLGMLASPTLILRWSSGGFSSTLEFCNMSLSAFKMLFQPCHVARSFVLLTRHGLCLIDQGPL